MKKRININRLILRIIFVDIVFLTSCGQLKKPPELIGKWKTDTINITVRTRPEKGNWMFTSDSASIGLSIDHDFTVDGHIGSAEFKNGHIKLNWLLPTKMTGQAFTIECSSIGKIFTNDLLQNKEVELWVSPLKDDGMDAELRYTEGLAYFPMAGMRFFKDRKTKY